MRGIGGDDSVKRWSIVDFRLVKTEIKKRYSWTLIWFGKRTVKRYQKLINAAFKSAINHAVEYKNWISGNRFTK